MSSLTTAEGNKVDALTETLSVFEIKPTSKMEQTSQEDQKTDCCEAIHNLEARNNIELDQNENTLDREYLAEQEYWGDSQPSSNINNLKQKPITQRMKLKEYNIIDNDKRIARAPSYYKLDRSTTLILQTLIDQQNSGDLHNIVSKGVTSVVIHANCYGKYHIYFPCGNAIKVYKLSNSVEKNNAIYKRVQRENEHLLILRNQHYSNNTPYPVFVNKNVILMSFIGTDQDTAPSTSTLPTDKLNDIYKEVVQEIDTWYRKLCLIHGSLSASTIIYWMDKLYVIGWSHSVKRDHPMALKKLMKDCQFVTTFFKRQGVSVKSAEELFKSVTGLEKISSKVLEVVHKDLWKDPLVANPNWTIVPDSILTRDRFKL